MESRTEDESEGEMSEQTFKLLEYNLRREMRTDDCARVGIYENGKLIDYVWMSRRDALNNLKEGFGTQANIEFQKVISACDHLWEKAGLKAVEGHPTLYKRIEEAPNA